jgi:hypothetical protein
MRDASGRYACISCYEEARRTRGAIDPGDTSELKSELVPEIVDEAADTATRCPKCSTERVPGTVLCTSCGYDLRTGDRLEPRVTGPVVGHPGSGSVSAMWDRIFARSRRDRVRRAREQGPWVFVVLGAGLVAMALATTTGDATIAAGFVAHLPKLGAHVAIGAVGLWIASRIWLGDVGPFPLAILRLAAVYSGAYAVALHTAPLPLDGWFMTVGAYFLLLMWLLRLNLNDAGLLGLLTIGMHVGVCFAVPDLVP